MNFLKPKGLNNLASNNAFDCGKMRLLIEEKSNLNFNDRFKSWIAECTKDCREKIWRDVEYAQHR